MTAIRCEVSDIIDGRYDTDDGPRVISPYGVEIRRAVLLGFVIDNYYSDNYASFTLDDGSGTIRAKGWGADAEALRNVEPHSFVMVIGKVREYEGERYIVPEVIRFVPDPNYLTLHKLERLRTILERSGMTGLEAPEPEETEAGGGLVVAAPGQAAPENAVFQQSTSVGADTSRPTGAPLVKQILDFICSQGGPVSNDSILEHFCDLGYDKSEITLKILDLLDDGSIIEDPIGVYRCE